LKFAEGLLLCVTITLYCKTMTATQARSVLLVASFLLAYYSYNLYHFVAGTEDKTKSGQDESRYSELLEKREDVSEEQEIVIEMK
jgi:hypothetical protein